MSSSCHKERKVPSPEILLLLLTTCNLILFQFGETKGKTWQHIAIQPKSISRDNIVNLAISIHYAIVLSVSILMPNISLFKLFLQITKWSNLLPIKEIISCLSINWFFSCRVALYTPCLASTAWYLVLIFDRFYVLQ